MQNIQYFLTQSQDGSRWYYRPAQYKTNEVDGLELTDTHSNVPKSGLPAGYPSVSLLPIDADESQYPPIIARTPDQTWETVEDAG